MLPHDQVQPAVREKSDLVDRVAQAAARASLLRRILIVVLAVVLGCPVLAPIAVAHKVRTRLASAYVAMLAIWLIYIFYLYGARPNWEIRWALLALPVLVAVVAHLGRLSRWYVPCRTVAVVLVWPVLVVIALNQLTSQHISPVVGVVAAWLLAVVALIWRMAKGVQQDDRQYGLDNAGRPQARRRGPGRPARTANPAAVSAARGTPAAPLSALGPRRPPLPYAEHAARDHAAAAAAAAPGDLDRRRHGRAERHDRAGSGQGAGPIDRRLHRGGPAAGPRRSHHGQADAALRLPRAARAPARPRVARVLAKIFYAFGLLETPEVVEAHRSDLVGEYLGATAIKTNELVDSAFGRVLFIDEAYSLVNEGDGQADRFGIEAVQTLLKRAEDNREDLIIILAGYEKQMEGFLASNPGLASRFATRLKFPSYSPAEHAGPGLSRRWTAAARSSTRRRAARADGGPSRRSAAAGSPMSWATAGSSAACWRRRARPATSG